VRANSGGTPSTKEQDFWIGNIPWITSADIDQDGHVHPRKYISDKAIEKSTTNLVQKGSIVVVTRVGLGKVGLADSPLCFSQDCQALIFNYDLIEPKFVQYQLTQATRRFLYISRGTTINGVTKKQLSETPFFLPPRNEQSRIVAKLEELFSDLDAGVAALQRAKANLKRYRASVLKAAVEGKLTALWRGQNPATETGAQLLARILKERRAKWEENQLKKYAEQGKTPPKNWQDKYPEPAKPNTSKLPELPEGWVWVCIEQMSDFEPNSITDGPFGSNLKTEHYTAFGPRVIRLKNIGFFEFVDAEAHISESHYLNLLKYSVKTEDIVIAMLGEILPRSCIVPPHVPPAIVKADCVKLSTNRFCVNKYLNTALTAFSISNSYLIAVMIVQVIRLT